MSVRKLPYYALMRASPTITRGRVTSHDPASAGDPKNSTLPYIQVQSPSTSGGPLADGVQQSNRTWARTGEYITLVSKDLALLGLPQAMEERVAAGGNHSTMVKFSSRSNPDYTKELDSLYRFEEEAKAVVKRKFCFGERQAGQLAFSFKDRWQELLMSVSL